MGQLAWSNLDVDLLTSTGVDGAEYTIQRTSTTREVTKFTDKGVPYIHAEPVTLMVMSVDGEHLSSGPTVPGLQALAEQHQVNAVRVWLRAEQMNGDAERMKGNSE